MKIADKARSFQEYFLKKYLNLRGLYDPKIY